MVYSHIRYSDRPFMGSVTAESRAEESIEMTRLVFGADFVEKNCVILGNVNVNSPLVWDGTMTRALRAYARANQAAVIVPFILGGAMGPVTNAGAIAQSLAETMAGCALTMGNYLTAFWDSEIADNDPFEKWEAGGSEDAAKRANRLWKKKLAEYEAPPLDAAIDEALQDYMATKKAGVADAWY